jgi:carbonic anhydrase
MPEAFVSTQDFSSPRYIPTCCGTTLSAVSRRTFLRAAGGSVLFASVGMLASGTAVAASGNYEAMVLSCIDPRFQDLVNKQQARNGLSGKYSAFTVAGASIGVVAPAFKEWHKTFWENLGASVQLHNIKKVIVVNHRDCGAAKIAYGDAKVANAAVETATHQAALMEFRQQLKEKHPNLAVQLGLMSLDGNLEQFA